MEERNIYKEMYLKLAAAQTEAIELLQNSMQETEELYISVEE